MKKPFVQAVCMLVMSLALGACARTGDPIQNRYKASEEEAKNAQLSAFTSMNRELFGYYLPPSIGRRSSTPTSVLLISNQEKILMNLDVVNVLNQAYYTDNGTNLLRTNTQILDALYASTGTYTNAQGLESEYQIKAFALSADEILLSLETENFIFSSIHASAVSPEILYDMLVIARSTTVNKSAVLAAFSTREIINYQKETLNMFTQLAPESGTVMDMVTGDKLSVTDGFNEEIPPETPTGDQAVIE